MRHLIVIAILLLALPAYGQSSENKDVIGALPEPAAPYDDKLLRLAEVLGSIHYLRSLCEAGEGNKWRETMASLLVAEKPGPKRKNRLIARFNRGYRAFNETYGSCTASAATAGERYRAEGIQIAGQIARRFGR